MRRLIVARLNTLRDNRHRLLKCDGARRIDLQVYALLTKLASCRLYEDAYITAKHTSGPFGSGFSCVMLQISVKKRRRPRGARLQQRVCEENKVKYFCHMSQNFHTRTQLELHSGIISYFLKRDSSCLVHLFASQNTH